MMHRNRVTRAAFLLAIAAALAATLGCGVSTGAGTSSVPAPAANTYLYVEAGAIAQLKVQDDGTLTPLTPATVGTPYPFSGSSLAAVGPDYQYLFASAIDGNGNFAVSQYVIGSDGTLVPNAIPTFSLITESLSTFAFTPDGKFAVAPTSISGPCFTSMLNTYGVSSSGTLSFGNQTPPDNPCEEFYNVLAIDSSGHFAYVLCNGYSICEFNISANGAVTLLSPASVTAESDVNSLTTAANGFLYAENNGGTLTAFSIDKSTGQLANAGSFATGTGTTGGGVSIAFNPAGTYAYVTNMSDNSVTQFRVDASSGALTMNGPDVATGIFPQQIAVDPSGRFAFVANQDDGTISQFVISDTGRLTPNGTFSLGADSYPTVMTFAQR